MSYLWLRISILYATMQINNQSAVSGAFVNCELVCVYVRALSQPCVVVSISVFF